MATATLNEIKIGQSFQTEFFTFGTMVSVVRVAYLIIILLTLLIKQNNRA